MVFLNVHTRDITSSSTTPPGLVESSMTPVLTYLFTINSIKYILNMKIQNLRRLRKDANIESLLW